MIKIYFDGVLIDDDYYANITNDFKLFDEEFQLGTTSSNTFNIEVPYEAVTNVPYNVRITIDDVDYANLIVDSFEISDDNVLKLELVDKMVLFNYNYDMSAIVPCTILKVLQNICTSVGIELATTEFANSDVLVNSYDNTITAREYIGYIAELAGGYAQIGKDGKLYIKTFNDLKATIEIDECEDFKIREYHKIERVVFDNGFLKYETSEDEELETLYLNSDNPFIDSENIFNNIVENILNFEFYCFETNNCPIVDVIAGDLIKFTDGEKEYITIAQYSLDFNGNWIGGYSLEAQSKQQQETKQTGISQKIKGINVRLDRDEAEMEIVANDISETNEKVATMNIDINNISTIVSNNYQETNEKLANVATTDNLKEIQESVKTLQSSTDYSINVINSTLENGVSKLKTNKGFTFDDNGFNIDESNSPTKFQADTNAIWVTDKTNIEELLFAGYDEELKKSIVRVANIWAKKYFSIGENDEGDYRLEIINDETYGTGLGFFYIGGDE